MPQDTQAAQLVDTLRLSDHQLSTVIDQLVLRQSQQAPRSTESRAAVRVFFDSSKPVTLSTEQMGGHTIHYKVRVWNISSTGIAVLHGTFMHKNTKCMVHLPDQSGKIAELQAYVMRCRLVAGHIHEIGMRFLKPLELRIFTPEIQNVSSTGEIGPNWKEPAYAPVLETFVNQLPEILKLLNPKNKDIAPVERAKAIDCLRRAAEGLGFTAIAIAALDMLKSAQEMSGAGEMLVKYQALRGICDKTSPPQ